MNEIKKSVLGRGLSSLLDPSSLSPMEAGLNKGNITTVPLDSIERGSCQPRFHFSEENLQELAASIRERGVLQPILLRPLSETDTRYELIAGERRWRAARLAGLTEIPALVRNFSPAEALEVALLENIQRQDLNPIEEANGYRRLAEEFNHTQESLSRILGKSRSHIANSLRLLTLPSPLQEAIKDGKLSAGHGRALLGSENPTLLADMVIKKGLSVREAEALAKKRQPLESNMSSFSPQDPEKDILQAQLSELLGKAVELIIKKGGGGKIVIPFKDPLELDTLIQRFNP